MSLYNLLKELIIVSRLTQISGGNKTSFSTVTAEYVNVQSLDENKTVALGGSIGKMFRCYADESANIEQGDKLVDSNGREYKVVSVNIPAQLGNFIHKEIILNLVDD